MKKIIFLLFFINIFLVFSVNADYIICDSGNINFNGSNTEEICNGGYMTGTILGADSFTGNFINLETGYWGTNNNYNKNLNFEENLPEGFFDINRETIIKKTNPDFNIQAGYLGTDFNYSNNLNIEANFPLGFFDLNKKTVTDNTNPEYSVPVGFLGNVVVKKSGGRKKINTIQYTYKEYFEEVFRNNSSDSGYSNNEYNTFIDNLLELLLNDNTDQNKVIDEIIKNRINNYIKNNSEFKENMDNLIKNLRDVNDEFNRAKTYKQKLYILRKYKGINY